MKTRYELIIEQLDSEVGSSLSECQIVGSLTYGDYDMQDITRISKAELELYQSGDMKSACEKVKDRVVSQVEINELIAEGDPMTPPDMTELKGRENLQHRELVRLHCKRGFSTSSLYQERVKNNPDFWGNFSIGRMSI